MADLRFDGINLGDLSAQLSSGRIEPHTSVHLDPDLHAGMTTRRIGWRPSLGQLAAAQSHLKNNRVARGDVFLFFGWFREVERHAGSWRYVPGSQGRHIIFGWLQIGEILDVAKRRDAVLAVHPWLIDHPHLAQREDYLNPRKNNTIYVAAKTCSFSPNLAGGGLFPRYRNRLCLTWPGRSRSQWRLPGWMLPVDGQSSLTYHPAPRWALEDNHALLKTVAKGQEFVFDADGHPQALSWLQDFLNDEC